MIAADFLIPARSPDAPAVIQTVGGSPAGSDFAQVLAQSMTIAAEAGAEPLPSDMALDGQGAPLAAPELAKVGLVQAGLADMMLVGQGQIDIEGAHSGSAKAIPAVAFPANRIPADPIPANPGSVDAKVAWVDRSVAKADRDPVLARPALGAKPAHPAPASAPASAPATAAPVAVPRSAVLADRPAVASDPAPLRHDPVLTHPSAITPATGPDAKAARQPPDAKGPDGTTAEDRTAPQTTVDDPSEAVLSPTPLTPDAGLPQHATKTDAVTDTAPATTPTPEARTPESWAPADRTPQNTISAAKPQQDAASADLTPADTPRAAADSVPALPPFSAATRNTSAPTSLTPVVQPPASAVPTPPAPAAPDLPAANPAPQIAQTTSAEVAPNQAPLVSAALATADMPAPDMAAPAATPAPVGFKAQISAKPMSGVASPDAATPDAASETAPSETTKTATETTDPEPKTDDEEDRPTSAAPSLDRIEDKPTTIAEPQQQIPLPSLATLVQPLIAPHPGPTAKATETSPSDAIGSTPRPRDTAGRLAGTTPQPPDPQAQAKDASGFSDGLAATTPAHEGPQDRLPGSDEARQTDRPPVDTAPKTGAADQGAPLTATLPPLPLDNRATPPATTPRGPETLPLDTTQSGWETALTERITTRSTDLGQEIEITLTPETLGTVRIKLDLSDKTATVQIVTDTPQAAHLFQQSEARLAEAFTRAGLSLASHDASSRDPGGRDPGGRDPGTGGQRQGQNPGNPRSEAALAGLRGALVATAPTARAANLVNIVA